MNERKCVNLLLGLAVPLVLMLVTTASGGAQSSRPKPGSGRPVPASARADRLIDDFSGQDPAGKFGTRWEFASDRAQGGQSSGKIEFLRHEDRSCLHLSGSVSGRDNGLVSGYIEAALVLGPGRKTFDARGFTGVRLIVKGNFSFKSTKIGIIF